MKEIVATLGIVLALALPAQAQNQCGNRLAIIKMLASKYKEAPKFIAIAGQINLVEIFISKSGTWTILITAPQGQTCIIAAGDSWDALPPMTILDGTETHNKE